MKRMFRLPFTRARIDGALDDELGFHLQGRVDEFVAAGMTRTQAEAEARRRFGDYDSHRRQTRDIDEKTMRDRNRVELFDTIRRELAHAVRALRRSPAFTVMAFVTLSLGLGATIAIYTVLESVVLRPLPYRNANELVSVLHPTIVPGSGAGKWGLSSAGYFLFKKVNHTLSDFGSYTTDQVVVLGDGADAEFVQAGDVTASIFTVLGAKAAYGRLILPADDQIGAPHVVVLAYDFWMRRYGGDTTIVGRNIQTDAGPVLVVGIVERGFNLPKRGPFDQGELAGFRVDVWSPLRLNPNAQPQNSHQYSGIGRLKPGTTAADAQKDLEPWIARLPELFPSAYSIGFIKQYHFGMGVKPLRDEVLGEKTVRILWVLFAAVALVLLIACANVANLFLVRMEARRREATIRAALGASRGQMAALYLSESMLLAIASGVAGIILAAAGIRALVAMSPADIPRLGEVSLHWTSMAFAVVISVFTGLAFGLIPLLRRAAVDTTTLRESSRGLNSSSRTRAVRGGLVILQVAFAMVLLVAAGLMVRCFSNLRNVNTGLNPNGVLVFSVALPNLTGNGAKRAVDAAEFHHRFQDRIAVLPGVTGVGATTVLPLRDFGTGCTVAFREGLPYGPDEKTPCIPEATATPGFFQALGIAVRGRVPDWSDVEANTGAVVVSKTFADRLWPGVDPIGKGVNMNGGTQSDYYRIVGVVDGLHARGVDQPPTEVVFYPAIPLAKGWNGGAMAGATYVVRTGLSTPSTLMPSIRRALAELDKSAPIFDAGPMTGVVQHSMARTSFIMTLLAVAAAMALLLSAVGIYGVISYVVAQRRPEIGVRIALGAQLSQVSRLVVMQSLRLAAIGVVIGLAGALAVTRTMRSLLFDVSPTDPVVLVLVPLLLMAIAAVASFVPARRAARVDPAEALRSS